MKKILTAFMLIIALCMPSTEIPVMAANTHFTYQQEISNKLKVGDKKYFFDWSYLSSTVRLLCENKDGKTTVVKKIQAKKFGFSENVGPQIQVCCNHGNRIYFSAAGGLDECGIFYTSVKTGEMDVVQRGLDYVTTLAKRYLVLHSDTGGDFSPYKLIVYDIKTGKKKIVNNQTGHVFANGKRVLYSCVPENYYLENGKYKIKICSYNVVSGKKTTLAKNVSLTDIYDINENYMAYSIKPETFKIKEFSQGKKLALKDGQYEVRINRQTFHKDKLGGYSANIKNNVLTIYGSYQTVGQKDTKAKGMYKLKLSSSYKIRIMEDEDYETINASQFNAYHDKTDYIEDMILTVKNKKVTVIDLIP